MVFSVGGVGGVGWIKIKKKNNGSRLEARAEEWSRKRKKLHQFTHLVKQAFTTWSKEASINFLQTKNNQLAEIRIMFVNKHHKHYNNQSCTDLDYNQGAHAFQVNSFEWEVRRFYEEGFNFRHIAGDIHLNREVDWSMEYVENNSKDRQQQDQKIKNVAKYIYQFINVRKILNDDGRMDVW